MSALLKCYDFFEILISNIVAFIQYIAFHFYSTSIYLDITKVPHHCLNPFS